MCLDLIFINHFFTMDRSNKMNWIKIVSRVIASLVILFIVIMYIPTVIREEGLKGLLIPNNLFTTVLVISAIGTWISKNQKDVILCLINIFGLFWIIFIALVTFGGPRIG
jgi:hypothetical protein